MAKPYRCLLLRTAWCALLAIGLGGCPAGPSGQRPHPSPPPPVTSEAASSAVDAGPTAEPPGTSSPPAADPLEQRAEQLISQARAAEPGVTAMLQGLAAKTGSELIKLKYRLKTKTSILRKIRLRLANDRSLTPERVVLDDTLRYTLQVADTPPGHHVAVVKEVLAALEANGHKLVRLKNYWPDHDNYSGCNTSLESPEGLLWELQFHTPESAATAERTRDWYEELRRKDTPVARKRELFDKMAAEWDKVPIPKGILERNSLHPRAEVIDRPRP